MVKPPQEATHQFSADRPIASTDDDLLGRSPFAVALAKALADWQQADSLVVALHGAWGSGKSSVKNMAVSELRKFVPPPYIVEFTPWQWAGQAQLAEAFFAEIGMELGRIDRSREGRKRAAKWRLYAQHLKVGAVGLGALRNTLAAVLAALAVIGVAAFTSATLRTISLVVGVVAALLAVVLTWGGDVADTLAGLFSAQAEAAQSSLADAKRELAKALCTLDHPVVVIIDDLDRLTPNELRLIFQLVKANADFPNLVYVLLFDRRAVETALERAYQTSGRDFLEKIIQVAFDLPAIERTRLNKILFVKLDELLGPEARSKRFNQQRWGDIFIGGLQPYFETLRDVNRYCATLSFHMGLFSEGDSFEVNPIDLIALEALRHFEPDVYQTLPDAKQALTDSQSVGGIAALEAQTKAIINGLIERASIPHQSHVQELLKQLFPGIEWVFGGSHYGTGVSEGWYRDLRVCHADVFDRYFFLTLPEGDISQATIERLLGSASDRKALAAELRALGREGLLEVALDRLEAYKEEISIANAVPFITALFDIGDELSAETAAFFSISSAMHAVRIIHWYLRKEPSALERFNIVSRGLNETVGVYLPVYFVSLEDSDDTKRIEHPDYFLIDADELPELKARCVNLIQAAAKDGRLVDNKNLGMLIHRWSSWSSTAEPAEWVRALIETDDGLLILLKAFVGAVRSQGIGSHVSTTAWRIRLSELEPFVSVELLKARLASMLVTSEWSEEDRRAVDALRMALRRKDRGLPEDAFRLAEE